MGSARDRNVDFWTQKEYNSKKSSSKTAESVEERENARKEYLDRKEILEDFRW